MSLLHDASIDSRDGRGKLTVPFLETSPLQDVQLFFLLLPLWWVLGLEQFIWIAGLLFSTVKLILLRRGQILANRPLYWYGAYLLVILVSSLFIVEPFRWLTYFRNLSAYAAGFLVVLIVTNQVRSWKTIHLTLKAVLVSVLVAGLLGVVGILGFLQTPFDSLIGQFLPDSIASTTYGQRIVSRSIGIMDWFSGIGRYFRLTSFYLFATHYATVLVYAIPFMFLYVHLRRGVTRWIVIFGIVILVINLIFTTGRVAMVSLLVGAAYFSLFHSRQRRAIRVVAFLTSGVAVLLLLASALYEVGGPTGSGLLSELVNSVRDFLFARGEGSFLSRFAVYVSSLEGFLERPLFGWGTERDVPGLRFPAGSHSEYFAVLYRQGLFGVITFVGLILATWRHTTPLKRVDQDAEPTNSFLRYGRWFFVTVLVNSVAADPVIDTTVYLVLWTCLGLLIAGRQLIEPEGLPSDVVTG